MLLSLAGGANAGISANNVLNVQESVNDGTTTPFATSVGRFRGTIVVAVDVRIDEHREGDCVPARALIAT